MVGRWPLCYISPIFGLYYTKWKVRCWKLRGIEEIVRMKVVPTVTNPSHPKHNRKYPLFLCPL